MIPVPYNQHEGFDIAMDYSSVKKAGPAARPLEFPTPTVRRGFRCAVRAVDHRSGKVHTVKNVLFRKGSNEAYLIRKKIARSIYGTIFHSVLMKRRTIHERRESRHELDEGIEWISTEQIVAVKVRTISPPESCVSLFLALGIPANYFFVHGNTYRFPHGIE
jgi:hypothetical protein